MWKRHQLVVGTVGIFLLAGSIVMSTAGVSGATTGEQGVVTAESRHGGRHGDHDRGRHDDKGKHDKCKHKQKAHHGKKGKCKPKPKPTTTTTPPTTTETPTTTAPEETTTTAPEETTTTAPEETTTTAPEETTTTAPEDTTTTAPEVGSVTTIRPGPPPEEGGEVQPQVAGITQQPEALPNELAFTGVSNGSIAAGGAGLLLIGMALVSGGARRRREA